ncbi:hypothetical protein [Ralstonia phage RpT1]|nr:hypothetical protein [Ralstonia phage RpT1]
MTQHVDIKGRPVKVGDEVVFAPAQHCTLYVGHIIKLNPKTVRIEYLKYPGMGDKGFKTVDRQFGLDMADFAKVGE